jgi:hypothetical protein
MRRKGLSEVHENVAISELSSNQLHAFYNAASGAFCQGHNYSSIGLSANHSASNLSARYLNLQPD